MAKPVAPGKLDKKDYNLLCLPGVAAIIFGDFDRDNDVDSSGLLVTVGDKADLSKEIQDEYLKRVIRPGAIVLANLDIDDPSRQPSNPALPASPLDRRPFIDAKDKEVNGVADEKDLTLIKTRKPNPCSKTADIVVMKIHKDDAKRIRIFESGKLKTPVLGDGSVDPEKLTLPVDPTVDFLVEALTLAGNPLLKSPSDPTPQPPEHYPADLPKGAAAGKSVHAKRAPGEVWIELEHQDKAAKPLKSPREVALLTIAPFMLLSNLQPVKRAYAVYRPGLNHDFIFDLAEACSRAFGTPTPTDSTKEPKPNKPADADPLYIINGTLYPDEWIQDEIEIGYCWAPHGWMNVVLHCKRNRPLKEFVHRELPAPAVGLFDAIHGTDLNAQDFGGNIEVSPPVPKETRAIKKGNAGPAVKKHPSSPFGKILLGDFRPSGLSVPTAPFPPPPPADLANAGLVHDETRDFFSAQMVQPILPVDTSWLNVGHVDEYLSFVPAKGGRGFKLLLASVQAMNLLLEEAVNIPLANERTNFHRGKWAGRRMSKPTPGTEYDEISVEDIRGPIKTYSNTIRTRKMIPIQTRLMVGLDLGATDIIPVPIYFKTSPLGSAPLGHPYNRTVAHTVGMVNMLVVDNHLMVPKPFGPRLKKNDAESILKKVLPMLKLPVTVEMPPDTGHWHWVRKDETIDRLGYYFAHPSSAADRQDIINAIKLSAVGPSMIGPLSPALTALVQAKRDDIKNAPENATIPLNVAGEFTKWCRVWIPEKTVDLLEAYMLSVLKPLGLTVHFIDDWFYHAGSGEVHCGTNAMREPPELKIKERWWDGYDPERDTTYDPKAP